MVDGELTGQRAANLQRSLNQFVAGGQDMPFNIHANQLQTLFDALPDVVFFVKDNVGRYTHANWTLVRRLGLAHRSDLIGQDVRALFPSALASVYAEQDERVLTGETVERQLELHVFANRAAGWCLTSKQPLYFQGRISGLVGISQDLGAPDGSHHTYDRLQRVVALMQARYGDSLRVADLAQSIGCSVAQLERHFRRIFQLSPRQVLTKIRIEAAMGHLAGTMGVAAISVACGFPDQSAFARRFKTTVGMTPSTYRAICRAEDGSVRPSISPDRL
jgi:AraC-like DNA-binding protein